MQETSTSQAHMPRMSCELFFLPAAAQSVNCSPIVANNNSFQTVDLYGKRIENKNHNKQKKYPKQKFTYC